MENIQKPKKLLLKLVIGIDLLISWASNFEEVRLKICRAVIRFAYFFKFFITWTAISASLQHIGHKVCLSFSSLSFARAGARLQIEFGASCNLTRDQYAHT